MTAVETENLQSPYCVSQTGRGIRSCTSQVGSSRCDDRDNTRNPIGRRSAPTLPRVSDPPGIRSCSSQVGSSRCDDRDNTRNPIGRRSASTLPDWSFEILVRLHWIPYRRAVTHRRRRQLPHAIPSWVNPHEEIYFVTVNCERRRHNQLAVSDMAKRLFETIQYRTGHRLWWPHVFLLMPDHVHALLSFPPSDKEIKIIMAKWKEWTDKSIGIRWQRDFFEHRLRHEESRRQKTEYILENPVRKGLVSRADDWPFVYFGEGKKPEFDD